MKRILIVAAFTAVCTTALAAQTAPVDTVAALVDTLADLASSSDVALFRRHCASITELINDRTTLTVAEKRILGDFYLTFADPADPWNSCRMATYLERKRPLIVAWRSPTDSALSLGWLFLPVDWDSLKTYPLYVILHGLYSPYQNRIEYAGIHFKPAAGPERSFNDGYAFFPWGRGNSWYEGIAETDVFEGIEFLEGLVRVDSTRKYLAGHSMGGYGAWALAQDTPAIWAAIGIHAGALANGPTDHMSVDAVAKLKNVPTYFVVGTSDYFITIDQQAYQMLTTAGNTACTFVTFNGGHEALLANWDGMYEWMKNYTLSPASTIGGGGRNGLPGRSVLESYPNPAAAGGYSTIAYSIASPVNVRLQVFDLLGREVSLLVDGPRTAGMHRIQFDGRRLPSGMYFCRLTAGTTQETKKMLLVR